MGALFFSAKLPECLSFYSHRVHGSLPSCLRWAHLGSNQGPTGYEPVALPAELWALFYYIPFPRGVNPALNVKFGVLSSELLVSISLLNLEFLTPYSELRTFLSFMRYR
jgi:hypothetical protein